MQITMRIRADALTLEPGRQPGPGLRGAGDCEVVGGAALDPDQVAAPAHGEIETEPLRREPGAFFPVVLGVAAGEFVGRCLGPRHVERHHVGRMDPVEGEVDQSGQIVVADRGQPEIAAGDDQTEGRPASIRWLPSWRVSSGPVAPSGRVAAQAS